jgi:hypothetical protein
MTKRHPDDPQPTWFRLSPESWAMIRAEYLNGATARALAKKYRVSPTSIYRHACQEGWTKEKMAEAVSRKSVADAEQKAADETAANRQREAEMNTLAEQIASGENASGIAAALERQALAQASVAMLQGRSKEAASLAALAEMMRKRVAAAAAVKAPERAALETLTPAELEQRALAQAGQALSRGEAAGAKALTAVAEQMRKRVEEERQREEAKQTQATSQVAEVRRCRELELAEKFRYAAFLAYCMVHNPKGAPAIFVDLVAGVRREAFGEGDDESYAAARRSAQDARRYFELDEDAWDAAFELTFPSEDEVVRDPSPAWAGGGASEADG